MRRALAVPTLAALIAGCGSYTKHDFVASADAICASSVRQTRAIAPPSFTNSKAQQLKALAAYLAATSPIVQSEAKQIRALQRPGDSAGKNAGLARYLAALAQAASDYSKLAAAAKAGDTKGVASAESALQANPVASLAARYGLRSCGTPSATVSGG